MADSAIIRQIGDIQAQITVQEAHHDETIITEHPVERGAQISDHVYRLPSRLSLQVAWSNTVLEAPDPSYLASIYSQLRGLMLTPLTVVTGKRTYQNMLIQTIELTTDEETEYALFISLQLREVILTQTTTIVFSDPSNQTEPQTTAAVQQEGTKQPAPVTQPAQPYLDVQPTATYEIPLSSEAQFFRIPLAGATYEVTMKWQEVLDDISGWFLDVADQNSIPLIGGIPLVTGTDLLGQYDYLGIGGSLYAYTDANLLAAPTYVNIGTAAHVIFGTP